MKQEHKHPVVRLGARIKALRKQKSISQEKLAEMINKSVDTVSSIERGVFHPRVGTAVDIAEALGVSIAELFSLPAVSHESGSAHEYAHDQILHLIDDQPTVVLEYLICHIKQIILLKGSLEREAIAALEASHALDSQ